MPGDDGVVVPDPPVVVLGAVVDVGLRVVDVPPRCDVVVRGGRVVAGMRVDDGLWPDPVVVGPPVVDVVDCPAVVVLG